MRKEWFSKRFTDLWAGIVTIVAAILIYLTTLGTKTFALSQIRPEFVPRLVCVAMLVLGVGIIIKWALIGRKAAEPIEEDAEAAPKTLVQKITPSCTFLLIFLYIFIMPRIGFTISTTLYLTCQITLLSTDFGWKSWLRSLIVAIIAAVLIFLAFAKGFTLALPINGWGF